MPEWKKVFWVLRTVNLFLGLTAISPPVQVPERDWATVALLVMKSLPDLSGTKSNQTLKSQKCLL